MPVMGATDRMTLEAEVVYKRTSNHTISILLTAEYRIDTMDPRDNQ